MTLLGQTRQDLPFTICSQFQPTVLEGQLCYSLSLSRIAQHRAKLGLKFGLVLILDPSEKEHTSLIENSDEMTSLSFETFTNVESSARIYLNTLASFTAYQAGSYALSALKKMTGTEGFLNLPSKVKGCKTETFEECHATRYLKEVHKQCGCVPWAIGLNQKVRLKFPANPPSPPLRPLPSAPPIPPPATKQSPPLKPTAAASPAQDSMQMFISRKTPFWLTTFRKSLERS